MLSLIALTDYLLLHSVQLFSSKCKDCLCVFIYFICFRVWNMIVFKLHSFSITGYFIHVDISYRLLSLLVISGIFGFYCSERKYMFLHSSAHVIYLWAPLDLTYCCSDTVFSFQVCFLLGFTKSQLLKSWSLVTSAYTLIKDFLSVTYQFPEFPLPQLAFVLTFTHSIKACISKAVGTGHVSPFTLLWESTSTWVLMAHLLPNASKDQADPQFTVQRNTILGSCLSGQEEQNYHLCSWSIHTGKYCWQVCLKTSSVWALPGHSAAEFPSHQQMHSSQTCARLPLIILLFTAISQQKLMQIH